MFFHNFFGDDSHLIIQALANDTRVNKRQLRVIGQDLEKFLLLEWGQHYQFKDSLQFLPGSLERLGESLKASGDEKFFYLNDMAERMKYTQEQRELIKQKGVCPYDWFDSEEKLKFPALPERKDFESVLRNEACSEEDYARAASLASVWVQVLRGVLDNLPCRYFRFLSFIFIFLPTPFIPTLFLSYLKRFYVCLCIYTFS